jgi:hypothetical protein
MNRTALSAALFGVALAAVSPALAGDNDDYMVVISRGEPTTVDPVAHAQLIATAGLTPAEATGLTLNDLAIAAFNAGADGDQRQGAVAKGRGAAAVSAQLAASAGLSPEVARGLGLEQVVMIKFDRDESPSDRRMAGF